MRKSASGKQLLFDESDDEVTTEISDLAAELSLNAANAYHSTAAGIITPKLPDPPINAKKRSQSTRVVGFSVSNQVESATQDQTSRHSLSSSASLHRKANLTIRLEDETRIVSSIHKAARKQTTGSIFSVTVDLSLSGALEIGVKDLQDSILAISLLKRENDFPGSGERAGLRIGDIIFGMNFLPLREGSKSLVTILKSATEKKKVIHIQGWRCHQLCSDSIPGYLFPRIDDMFVQGFSLMRTKIFNESERWNYTEILLGQMVEDLHIRLHRIKEVYPSDSAKGTPVRVKARQMQLLDLERNILQAKGLRGVINVRIVHTKAIDDTTTYILRVEDVESGVVWMTQRRYNEFYNLYEELNDITHFVKEVDFPRKRIIMRQSPRLIEIRVAALEQFIRSSLFQLTLYASTDITASKALSRIQHFLNVDGYIDCLHPPIIDDQRAIEIMTYRFLNDPNSPSCQQCVKFVNSVDLESMLEQGQEGYKGLLSFMHDALAEVEQFVQQQHEQQVQQFLASRRPDWTADQRGKLIRASMRRQVESALYLPLRRSIFRLIQPFIAPKMREMQQALALLQQAKPSILMIDPNIPKASKLPTAIKSFRKALMAYLPVDQGQFLVEAATSIADIYKELKDIHRKNGSSDVVPSTPMPPRQRSIEPTDKSIIVHPSKQVSMNSMALLRDIFSPKVEGGARSKSPAKGDSFSDADNGSPIPKLQSAARRKSFQERLQTLIGIGDADAALDDGSSEFDMDINEESHRVSFSGSPVPSISVHRDSASKQPLDRESYINIEELKSRRAILNPDEAEMSNSFSAGRMRSSIRINRLSSKQEPIIDPLLSPPDPPTENASNIDIQAFEDVFERFRSSIADADTFLEAPSPQTIAENAISADDFLPIFTYVLIHCQVPQLFMIKELMVTLIANEDAFGECGYYLATMEAAIQHILDLASQFDASGRKIQDLLDEDHIYDDGLIN